MDKLKTIIEQEVKGKLPSHFQRTISDNVLRAISAPKRQWSYKLAERRDNILLLTFTIFCISIIYVFGYNHQFKINFHISENFLQSILLKVSFVFFAIFILIHEYFEDKKKMLI